LIGYLIITNYTNSLNSLLLLCDQQNLSPNVSRVIVVAKSKLRYFRKARKHNPNAKIPYYKKPYVIIDKP
jgi:hypothetical protein